MSMLTANQILSMYSEDASANNLGVVPTGGLFRKKRKIESLMREVVSTAAPLDTPEEPAKLDPKDNDPTNWRR